MIEKKRMLSGSVNGKGIKITRTATPGDIIHVARAGTAENDFVRLFAVNPSGAAVLLTLEWGTTETEGNITQTIRAADGYYEITPDGGLPINNSLVITIFAATANVLIIYGKVSREEAQ